MTQEEKAKQYDEVLEKAKSWYVDAQIDFKKTLEALFPTIKENEDERVRKAIISGMKALQEKGKYTEFAHIPMDEVFTWLEKQGKKKLDDEVEPKFHKGEWIVFNGLTLYIKEVVNGYYRTISFGGINNSYDWDIDNIARLWTIHDAREGDVLACCDNKPFIFKGFFGINFPNCLEAYCGITLENQFRHCNGKTFWTNQDVKPATKEQRDTLEKAMIDAGYAFDFEKKELKKLGQPEVTKTSDQEKYSIPSLKDFQEAFELKARQYDIELPNRGYDIYAMCKELYSLLIKQNPTKWSDEDERNMQNIDSVLFYDRRLPEDTCVKLRNFLKTIKERIGWKPSEEQISSLRDVIYSLPHQPVLFTLYNDLKKLKGE